MGIAGSSSSLGRWLGLAGVAPDENPQARRWAKRFEWPMLFLALWMLITWYLSLSNEINPLLHRITDLVIWCFFLAETLLLSLLVNNRRQYLLRNWMNLVILLLGLPVLWGDSTMVTALRMLRVVLILSLLMPMGSTIHAILARNNLGTTLLVSAVFVGLSGTFISVIDPAIRSPWEGIWWALVTVTTVGYGDLVPSSTTGKVFAAILIFLGIGLFSLLTASFSVFFFSREEDEAESREQHLLTKVEALEGRLEQLEGGLKQILDSQQQLTEQQRLLLERLDDSPLGRNDRH